MIQSSSGFSYETKFETMVFGVEPKQVELRVETLADIDATIDGLFKMYLERGQQELFEEMCPYFGILWPAGRVLAEMTVDLRDRVSAGASVLEVGCGLALPSLILAKLGLRPTAMDIHPDVPVFLERNCRENGLDALPCILADWSKWAGPERWDLVLASDVLYDKVQPQTLLSFLDRVVAPGGRALVADPGRGYWSGFLDDARMRGWSLSTKGLYGVNTCELRRV
ncbi:MAG: methyltransferase domain-containing protein [Bdellovibrionaceae bacterium]|nr:methyltransferase domain-containing protein [Pseudobdellovibrionaceae bacterium]